MSTQERIEAIKALTGLLQVLFADGTKTSARIVESKLLELIERL